MSFLSAIPLIGKLFDGAKELASEAIVDKDKQNEFIAHLEDLQRQIDRELTIIELQVKTVPWVDALHKMGRQITNYLTLFIVLGLMLAGKEITPTVAAILGGPNIAYQLIKGKGK